MLRIILIILKSFSLCWLSACTRPVENVSFAPNWQLRDRPNQAKEHPFEGAWRYRGNNEVMQIIQTLPGKFVLKHSFGGSELVNIETIDANTLVVNDGMARLHQRFELKRVVKETALAQQTHIATNCLAGTQTINDQGTITRIDMQWCQIVD